MSDWAERELGNAELGNSRRVRRLVKAANALAARPATSIPGSCGSWADTEAAYRLFDNPHVTPEAIYAAHAACTVARAGQQETVLAIFDGSSLDFTKHKATSGLGYLENEHTRGLMLHPSLLASPEGDVLGLLGMRVWSRPPEQLGKRETRRQRPIEEKESYVWLQDWQAAQEALPADVLLVGIADQEADIFELFAVPRRPGAHLVIRATGDRRVRAPAGLLGKAIRSVSPSGTLEVEVPRRPELPSRKAFVSVRFLPLSLLPPLHGQPRWHTDQPVWAILLDEDDPPSGCEALRWLLLTTMPVETLEDALRIAAYYKRRWLVEQFFYTLKQGCQVEKLQLESAERLETALALYAVVAWRLLHLTLEVRRDPHGSAADFLAEHEWKALNAYWYRELHPGLRVPRTPPTKHEAIRYIARLGGFLARKGDGEPGVKTIWQGLTALARLATGYLIASESR